MTFIDERCWEGTSLVMPPSDAQIPGIVIVVFEDRIVDFFKKHYAMKKVATMKECAPVDVYSFECNDVEIGFYQTPVGAPATAIFMERAIAFGARRFIFFGSCGGIGEGVESGQMILPTAAYRGDGASGYYLPYSDYIDIECNEAIKPLFDEEGLECLEGRVCTTDAMFRETKRFIDRRLAEGCIAIEMECSLIASIAKCKGVFASSLLFTDDVVSEEEWRQYENSKVLCKGTITKIARVASRLQ